MELLDLADNDLIVQNPNTTAAQTTLQQIRIAIVSAANQGMWDGSGLTATAIIGHPSGLTTLGFAHNQELGLSQFAGQTVDLQSVLVKFTYYGDSNLDGFVTDDDLGYFLAGYGVDNSQNPWLLGDYNLDGFTTDDDLGYFLASYGHSNQLNATPIQAIPEAQPWVLLGGLVLILYDRVRVWSRQKIGSPFVTVNFATDLFAFCNWSDTLRAVFSCSSILDFDDDCLSCKNDVQNLGFGSADLCD